TQRVVEQLKTTGRAQPFEQEYVRKDGSRVPVLVGGIAAWGETRQEAVALVVDLTEQKKAEAKIRRLVDSNIIGIIGGQMGDGRITEVNDAFLTLVGYDRDDLLAGRVLWPDLTAPEWRHVDQRTVEQLKAEGVVQPFEKEFMRKDGSRVPVLVGAAAFGAARE